MDNREVYNDQGTLGNFYNEAENSKANQFTTEGDEHSITREQISDLYAEGTIDSYVRKAQSSSQA
ncbi:DUF4025 domain-containing protein [Bacillus sp. 165]|uniref:DUF4025 domain-containing protein n=1 Tax=Bacillus sp. 165 TaxID=1529117 RepID=UPI001ADC50B5|nr:DUF4025 domain-containing protein [Bacillus sp. 165]MBO9128353.1 DUF4025 domain-containing protein [Bacillus sp. 165]